MQSSSRSLLRRDRITNRGPSPNHDRPLIDHQSTPPSSSSRTANNSSLQHCPGGTPPIASNRTPQPPRSALLSQLIDQQAELQRSNARIERQLSEISSRSEAQSQTAVSKKARLPKELSGLVHEVHQQMNEDAEEEAEWNFRESFDHSSNGPMNTKMLANIEGLQTDVRWPVVTIKRAMRTYFKTLKSRRHRERTDKQRETTTKQRRRQRMINKAAARKKAVKASSSLSADEKTQLEPLMNADFMSSDETISPGSNSDLENDDPLPTVATQRKRLMKHTVGWRSTDLQEYIRSVDRKIARRRTERGKMMVLDTVVGEKTSTRPAPADCPEWAKTVFDQ